MVTCKLYTNLISLAIVVELIHILKYFHIIHYFRIGSHVTTHTKDSVYIIGGWTGVLQPMPTSTIAKYKDDIWTIAGHLKQARSEHGAITINGRTMIIGGESPIFTNFYRIGSPIADWMELDTEIWDFESSTSKIIHLRQDNPSLSRDYSMDFALFPVEVGFCRKT